MRLLATTLALFAATGVAQAATYDSFVFTSNGKTVTATLPTTFGPGGFILNSPAADHGGSEIDYTGTGAVVLNSTGATETDPSDYFQFYTAGAAGGGFSTGNTPGFPGAGLTFDDAQTGPFGVQLYTIAGNVVNFTLGLTTFSDGSTINIQASTTPEPSSLVLLGTGVLGLAGAVRRRFSR